MVDVRPVAEAERVEDLYGIEPRAFTAARNALVKKLRAAGHKEEAARVGRLRRPPATAWALNMVARNQPALISEVLDRGGDLRVAMEKAVGGDASDLHSAQAAERRAVEAATSTAISYLKDSGNAGNEAARQRMAATLRAAVVDDSVADLLREGVLDSDHDQPGFGLENFQAPAEKTGEPADEDSTAPGNETSEKAQADAEDLRRRALQLEAAVRAADEAAASARQAVSEAEAELSRLEQRLEQLKRDSEDAERASVEARQRAAEATEQAEVVSGRIGGDTA